jgi:hypothetical protein
VAPPEHHAPGDADGGAQRPPARGGDGLSIGEGGRIGVDAQLAQALQLLDAGCAISASRDLVCCSSCSAITRIVAKRTPKIVPAAT